MFKRKKRSSYQGVDKFLLRHPIFWAPDQARKKMGTQKQIARPIETQLKTLLFALYCLEGTYNPSFLMPKRFRSDDFIV